MKIKLEPQKTTLRVGRDEFQTLLIDKKLHERTMFSSDASINFYVFLKDLPSINFKENDLTICLPNHAVINHKPNKSGLIFMLQDDNVGPHELVFQVDIKKILISSNNKNTNF